MLLGMSISPQRGPCVDCCSRCVSAVFCALFQAPSEQPPLFCALAKCEISSFQNCTGRLLKLVIFEQAASHVQCTSAEFSNRPLVEICLRCFPCSPSGSVCAVGRCWPNLRAHVFQCCVWQRLRFNAEGLWISRMPCVVHIIRTSSSDSRI